MKITKFKIIFLLLTCCVISGCSNRKEDEPIITIDKEETDVDLDAVLQYYK